MSSPSVGLPKPITPVNSLPELRKSFENAATERVATSGVLAYGADLHSYWLDIPGICFKEKHRHALHLGSALLLITTAVPLA